MIVERRTGFLERLRYPGIARCCRMHANSIPCAQPSGEVGSGVRAAVPRTGPDAMWRRHKARRSVRSTVKDDSYDAIVIGTGPGGEGAAMQARKLGRSVAVVERMRSIGGACTHLGTIP